MARASTMNVSLSAEELRLVRERVRAGEYASESDVIRESPRLLFAKPTHARTSNPRVRTSPPPSQQILAAGYRACARYDRRTARQWAQLADEWPEK